MSSLLDSLDMSLDDLLAKKKQTPKQPKQQNRKKTTSAGPVRKNRPGRRQNRKPSTTPYARQTNQNIMDVDDEEDDENAGRPQRRKNFGQNRRRNNVNTRGGGGGGKSSILSRIGNSNANLGTKILVKHLKYDILEDDVKELFSTVGEVKKTQIVYDRSGRSTGVARVWLARRSDALKAIQQYNGRTLDGQAMQIFMGDGNEGRESNDSIDNGNSSKKSMFGTALRNEDDNVKFNVTFGDGGRRRGGRGGGGGGARGNGRSRGGGRPKKTAEDLDNEMEEYMKDN